MFDKYLMKIKNFEEKIAPLKLNYFKKHTSLSSFLPT